MKKLLNTLYVTTPESYLSKDGENVVIKVKDIEKFRIPIHNLDSIVSFGYMGASPSLMKLCTDRNVGLCFLSEHGSFKGRISGEVRGNVLLRRKQYRMADDKVQSLKISGIFIAGKISNTRNIVQRLIRDHASVELIPKLQAVSNQLTRQRNQVLTAETFDILRGYEGDAANAYFGVFDHLIVAQKTSFPFTGRNRRPPKDNVNALLSFVYTLLAHETQTALESVGLDPYVGFLHTDRPGRASLALDMMEELRAYLADRLVLTLINRKQISGKGFIQQGEQGIVMNDTTRKEVLVAWQKRKQEQIKHPFLDVMVPIGLLPYIQAMLLARFVRGDIDNYPVFVLK